HSAADDEWTLVRCRKCGLIYLNPRPGPSNLASYYPRTYYAYAASPVDKPIRLKQRVRRAVRANRILCNLARRSPLADRVEDGTFELLCCTHAGHMLDRCSG